MTIYPAVIVWAGHMIQAAELVADGVEVDRSALSVAPATGT